MDARIEIWTAIAKIKAHPFTIEDLRAANSALNNVTDSDIKFTIKWMSLGGECISSMHEWDGPWQLKHHKPAWRKAILAPPSPHIAP